MARLIALLIGSLALTHASEPVPLCLNASQFSISTGQPSLQLMASSSVQIPIWSLSGGTVGQSIAAVCGGLPRSCEAVKVQIVVTSTDATTSPDHEDVYRVHLSSLHRDAPFSDGAIVGTPVRTALPAAPFLSRTITLESYCAVDPGQPLWLRIQREPGDPADTFTQPIGLALVQITPLDAPAPPRVVQDTPGYNSWPMLQALGDKLVCVYSRGSGHSIGEDARAVYARTSSDQGQTWSPETVVADSPGYGDVAVGKGLDSTGAMLLWVRRVGKDWQHDLYRSTDGVTFSPLCTPQLPVPPVQITDVFTVPDVGLMALWFAGKYAEDDSHSWGTLTSRDDGASWTQTTIESGLSKSDWPTEPAAVYLGDGRILAIARTEQSGPTTARAQFQLTSTDSGATWTRRPTNIGDVTASTPSLIL
ncbi:MAG: exo-alpha-sialidase, partial [Verrucomicrobiales bacterium]|nr:exo-alpha-sialidase [Verrucomicrobiales bacterium]